MKRDELERYMEDIRRGRRQALPRERPACSHCGGDGIEPAPPLPGSKKGEVK